MLYYNILLHLSTENVTHPMIYKVHKICIHKRNQTPSKDDHICAYVHRTYTPKMCKFLLMQVKQNICRIELYNDNGR